MGTYTDCLRDVVGISKNECICYNAGVLPEYSVSKSGLFLDDFLYGIPLSYPAAAFECDENDLWLLMAEARRQGILRFMSEFGRASISTGRYRKQFNPFVGNMGGEKKLGNAGANNWHVMGIAPKFSGATLNIKAVTLRGDELLAGGATAYLINETMMNAGDVSTPLQTFTGAFSVAGVAKCTTTDVYQIDCLASDLYFIVWDNQMTRNPFDIAMEREIPRCCSSPAIIAGWDTYVQATSFQTADLTQWESATIDAAKTQGIQLQTSFTCDALFLCDNVDFENDDFGRVIAELILIYSVRQLIGYMLASDKINVYTAARSEELLEKDAMLAEELPERLKWASENVPLNASPCYRCNPRQRRRSNLI